MQTFTKLVATMATGVLVVIFAILAGLLSVLPYAVAIAGGLWLFSLMV
ncbi:hypothetical protein [Vibrio phage ICP3]|uniref:Uncharacterized protein orf15 n=1 Tax=Vibrio phage ICP3 TaxID=979535 RepID=F1D011_9CAUD|nr:hypothetical protein ViPhICP3_gp15 [Vibrio phage ICP3]ADX87455.1 hypothetical protein [Vibrio phage ICP3]